MRLEVTRTAALKWTVAFGLAISAVLVFVVEGKLIGFAVLGLTVITAFMDGRKFGLDLSLIFIGVVIMGAVPVTTDIGVEHMAVMGAGMIAAISIPYLASRYVLRTRAISFPVATGQRWTRRECGWLFGSSRAHAPAIARGIPC